MTETNVIVAIDDIHPEQGWGCEGDIQIEYLDKLWEKYGCKFSLFIPSYYHDEYPLTKDWIKFWESKPYIEFCSHGRFHNCKKYPVEQIGEQEFLELDFGEATERCQQIIDDWKKVGHRPKGFRAPGWGVTQDSANAISNYFEWVAGHEEINRDIEWNCSKYFVGCDGIHETENLQLYGNTFMFQSHIQGDWNDKVWNEENYLHFDKVLNYLLSQYELQFQTISEIT